MMIPFESMKLSEQELDDLLLWAGLFFENGLRLMHLSNFFNGKTLDKEIIIHFLQEKVKIAIESCEREVGIESDIKLISEDAQRMILSMLEMIKLEADNVSYYKI